MAKILFVSTWGSHCGVATYTERLAYNLFKQDNKVFVLAPMEPQTGIRLTPPEVPFKSGWERHEDFSVTMASYAAKVDIVHFQHEYGIFQTKTGFLNTILAAKRAGAKTVVTLHTVFATHDAARFYSALRNAADLIIVHTPAAAAFLSAAAGPAKIALIGHGTPAVIGTASREEGREFLKVPRDGICVLVFGFMSENKNHEMTVLGFLDALRFGFAERTYLVLCGDSHDNGRYLMHLASKIEWAFAEDVVFLRSMFVDEKDLVKVFAAADLGILNTVSAAIYSASGQVHEHAAHGLPFMAANAPIYRDAAAAGAPLFELDSTSPTRVTTSFVSGLLGLVANADLRAQLRARLQAYGARTSWSDAAAAHNEWYKRLLGG